MMRRRPPEVSVERKLRKPMPEVQLHSNGGYWRLVLVRYGKRRGWISVGAKNCICDGDIQRVAELLTAAVQVAADPVLSDLLAKLQAAAHDRVPHRDGPQPPATVRVEGRDHRVAPQVCRVLVAMWKRDRLELSAFDRIVWSGKGRPKRKARSKAIVQANAALADLELPWRLRTTDGVIEKIMATAFGGSLVAPRSPKRG